MLGDFRIRRSRDYLIRYSLVVNMSGGDAIVNIVLRESYPDIVDLLNVDQVASLLFASGRITLPELDQLQGASGILLTDHKRKHILYSAALADKGQKGLDAFLRALCETAGQYEPHAQLLDKLCMKLKARGISPNTVMSKQQKFTRGTGSSATNMSVMEDSQEVVIYLNVMLCFCYKTHPFHACVL